jgi:CheY-like chemotaxis protein
LTGRWPGFFFKLGIFIVHQFKAATLEKRPLKLMYVDDDPDDRFFFESAAKIINDGLSLTSYNNGAVALKELQQADFAFDLLFLDLNMPIKSGFDVLDELQEVIKDRHLKIVIFTTSGNPASIEATYKLNAVLYVQKPGSFDELVKIIRSIVSMHSELNLPVSFEQFKFSGSYA